MPHDNSEEEVYVQPILRQHLQRLRELGFKRKKPSRQHANPLASIHQQPIVIAPDWFQRAYARPNLRLHVDIGCAYGEYTMCSSIPHSHTKLEPLIVWVCLRSVSDGNVFE